MFEIVKNKLEQLSLVIVAGVTKLIFMVYKVFAPLLAVTLLLGIIFLYYEIVVWNKWYALALLIVLILFINHKTNKGKDNPHRKYSGISGWFDARIDRFIEWIGTLKYFKFPICLVEDPGSYKIKGYEIRKLIDDTSPDRLQPGDILLRGYDGYLDGLFIRWSGNAQGRGKYFSHAALYLGELAEEKDKPIAARRLQVADETGRWRSATLGEMDVIRNDPEYFQPGKQMVIHAMSRGIFVEDILTFLRCDYLAVLRLKEKISVRKGDFDDKELVSLSGSAKAEAIRARLKEAKEVGREEIIELVHDSALGKIGACYDFQFNDIKKAYRFSCSEFVYYCYKSIHGYLGLHPKEHGFMGRVFIRESITPGDIYDAAEKSGKFDISWASGSLPGGNPCRSSASAGTTNPVPE